MSALDILKSKVKNTNLTDEDYEAASKEAEQTIKNFCNISTVPSDLEYVWANIAADILRSSSSFADPSNPIPADEIGSISVGDVSITRSSRKSGHSVDLDSFILNYKSILLKYRLLRW